jgi:glucokinase
MILVGDVGGTRTRLAFAERGADGWRITGLVERRTGPDILDAVSGFVRAADGRVAAAAFSGAGAPASDGSIRLTNANVRLEASELARAAGVARALLVNDFRAIAEGIPVLPRETLRSCGGGPAVPGEPVAVVGPGTGLGTAIGVAGPRGWFTIQGDGGHADLAPVDDEELEIWLRLRRSHGRLSAESVLSGPGLERLYTAIAEGAHLGAADIDAAAWRGDPAAVRAHALFTRWLGRVAGNLALIAGARGGVYLAGGILPRWGERFDVASFRRAFEDKAPYTDWLRAIPAFLVMHPQPGLLGLAVLAEAAT